MTIRILAVLSFIFITLLLLNVSKFSGPLFKIPNTNKRNPHTICSASLSSVDSEESLRAAERLHNRQSRNSAGGISTHSLNEAELVVSGTIVGL